MLPTLPDLPVLLAAARCGDATAIHSLYQAYGASLYRYCYARLGRLKRHKSARRTSSCASGRVFIPLRIAVMAH